MAKRQLDVYLHEKKVGVLAQQDDDQLTFAYAPNCLSEPSAGSISISMPVREERYKGAAVRAFFSGLLPDGQARQRLANALGISEGNTFRLLEAIGGDCAGALSFFPPGAVPHQPEEHPLEPLSEDQLAATLNRLRDRPLLGGEAGVRLSLAGAQDKLAVCLVDGKIALAKNGRPTTHILKPSIEGLEGVVENEVFCMKLAAKVGLTAPEVSKGSTGEIDYFLVERFDRAKDEFGRMVRLHQEDFCQTLGIPPEIKYEDEGGPGIEQCQSLIRTSTRRPAADQLKFRRMVLFHYLIGNADAHGKNYALLYSDAVPELAPVYDAVCTAVYRRLSKDLAMKVGGRKIPDTIGQKHWSSLAPNTKTAQKQLRRDMRELAGETRSNADLLLRELKEQDISHAICNKIRKTIEKRVKYILQTTEDA